MIRREVTAYLAMPDSWRCFGEILLAAAVAASFGGVEFEGCLAFGLLLFGIVAGVWFEEEALNLDGAVSPNARAQPPTEMGDPDGRISVDGSADVQAVPRVQVPPQRLPVYDYLPEE